MALAQSLWEGSTAHQVLSPLDARRAQGAGWAVNSASITDVRLGVVYAGDTVLLNPTAGLSVNVSPFHFLSSKDPSTGVYQGTNYSATAVTVPAAPSSGNKRIDTIWVAQQDQDATIGADASTVATFGVVTGAATAGIPVKSAAPTGCTEIGTVTWDSTTTVATATNAAQCTLAATCLWTASRGAPIPVRNQAERDALTAYTGLRVLRLDRNCAVEMYNGSAWDGVRVNFTPAWSQVGGTVLAIGNGTISGRYKVLNDDLVVAQYSLVRGSTTNQGSAAYIFDLPFVAADIYQTGSGVVVRGTEHTVTARLLNNTQAVLIRCSDNARISNTVPGSWAAGDSIQFTISYFRS